jgi:outer membrane receptor protein involved in Fe transport
MKTHILLATCAASVLTLAAGGAYAADAAATAANQSTTIGELVVTAERREENLQDTPVAVSAFSSQTMSARGLNGGQDLLLQIPNVNYSRTNFGGYDLKIRGIGTDVIGFGGTAGVGINENELPLGSNHLADTDFYDTQRVEIVRGPQGTLYGRNATGGAVDVITNLPTQTFNGFGSFQYGNYNTYKATGAVNIPFGDDWALRVAGFRLYSEGFGVNEFNGARVDGRDLGSIRVTLRFHPSDRLDAYLLFEHFQEDDTRNRIGKQLCIPDPGPSSVGGVPVTPAYAAFLNQGCIPGRMDSAAAYGNYNTLGTLAGVLDDLDGLATGNLNANLPPQDRNLHNIASRIQPLYTGTENLIDFHVDFKISPHLTLTNIFGVNENWGTSAEDYNRIITGMPFNPTGLAALLFPGGFVNDPQIGNSNVLANYDYGTTQDKEYTEELRLASSFDGKFNFVAGAFYSELTSHPGNTNYYVESNALTAFSIFNNTLPLFGVAPPLGGLVNIGQGYPPNGDGHNYYDARGGGGFLKTYAGFGEVYYDITPTLKLTLGGRYNVDQLLNYQYPISLLSAVPNGNDSFAPFVGGFPTQICSTSLSACIVPQRVTYRTFTGRANLQWTPVVSFTDKTMLYASYSRGYKGGGFNTPCQASLGASGSSTAACGYPLAYNPEYINAYEIGTKNTLDGGRLTLDLTGFYYDYIGYQISRIVSESSVNENINAKIYGVELESVWSPIHNFAVNANVGYLHTRIDNGETSIDSLNLSQGDPNFTLVKTTSGANCLATTSDVAEWMEFGLPAAGLGTLCTDNLAHLFNPAAPAGPSAGANSFGVPVDLGGKQLPNSPHWTINAGAQYTFDLANDWHATPRVDWYWQDSSFARIYNAVNDFLPAYHVVNATLIFNNAPMGLELKLFVKNLFNAQPITGTYVTDPTSALFTNVFTLDPRTYGAQLTKRF